MGFYTEGHLALYGQQHMFWQIKIKQNKNSEYGLQQELIGNSREKLYLLNAMHKHDIYMFDCYIDLT